jgi:hypothetical protein
MGYGFIYNVMAVNVEVKWGNLSGVGYMCFKLTCAYVL